VAIDLSGHEELTLKIMTALIQQTGTLYNQPDHPLRRLLMKLLAFQTPPWSGASGQELWNAIRGEPFFRGSSDHWPLEALHAALQDPTTRLTYSANPATPADLILNEDELGTLRKLTPCAADCIAAYGEPSLPPAPVELSQPPEAPEAPSDKAPDKP